MTKLIKNESQFTTAVREEAELAGWELIYHTHDSRRSDAGFPDLVLVKGKRLIFAELKYDSVYEDWDDRRKRRATVSEAQHMWLDGLAKVPSVEVYIWRYPQDATKLIDILER